MKAFHFAAAAVAALAFAGVAQAQDFKPKAAGVIMLNVRATDVSPDAGDPIYTAAGVDTGLKADVGDGWAPTIGLTYFFTDKIAAELIAGTTHHHIRATGPGVDLAVRDQWVLPPTLSLQYHPLPAARFSPYVGAGVNYMFFYAGKNKNGFRTDLHNGVGWALQAGADIAVKGPYSVNLDVKKVFFNTDATIDGGALTSKVKLDPWVISAGLGYKF